MISLTSPLQVGIYDNTNLIDRYESSEKTSDILPTIFNEISKKYDLKNLYYAKGPGSFMAIKITYIFLKSISIIQNIPLFATDGFIFNQNNPIKAIGTLYFIKKDGIISTQKNMDVAELNIKFKIPTILDTYLFSTDNEPMYVLPAV